MDAPVIVIVLIATAVVALPAVLYLRQRSRSAVSSPGWDPTAPPTGSRPAGPGAEGMYVPEAGEIAPGPPKGEGPTHRRRPAHRPPAT